MGLAAVNRRWLMVAVLAGCVCALSILAATTVAIDNTADEIFSSVAWLSAIVLAFSAVRSGVDAGVHRPHESTD